MKKRMTIWLLALLLLLSGCGAVDATEPALPDNSDEISSEEVCCRDEPPLLQLCHILAHGVLTHAHRFPDVSVAGPALMGPAVLQILQIAVDRQLSMRQPQQKNFIGE